MRARGPAIAPARVEPQRRRTLCAMTITAVTPAPRARSASAIAIEALHRARRDRGGAAQAHQPVIRDLMRQEGMLTTEPPHWARSQHVRRLYLQIGDWMVFILRHEAQRYGKGYTAVTAVNGPSENTWDVALRLADPHPPAPDLQPAPSTRSTPARRHGGVRSEGAARASGPRSRVRHARDVRRKLRNRAASERAQAKRANQEAERARDARRRQAQARAAAGGWIPPKRWWRG